MRRFLILVDVVLGLVSMSSWALPSDQNQPLNIQADQAVIDQRKGVSTYRGKVHVVQGTMEINGNELIMHHDDAGKPTSITINGSLATYKQQIQLNEPEVHGEATQMLYMTNSDILTLIGKARVTRGTDVVEGEKILYDRQNDRILANGETTGRGQGRVQITITPKPNPMDGKPTNQPAVPPPK
jgi:lipopolysaccharide export system protein LptA